MNRFVTDLREAMKRVPRASGDEPTYQTFLDLFRTCSPRQRG